MGGTFLYEVHAIPSQKKEGGGGVECGGRGYHTLPRTMGTRNVAQQSSYAKNYIMYENTGLETQKWVVECVE
jgi:hypothetical protein